ncbi:alpha/beta hydrolase [Azospira restricta]|uniref:Alpha/beta hydrolase n=1 Tax=Azospira restricta TaxID=404405 RepID=A0A974Y4M7_9RHOO|nr:alpha/beta hydrolase [Azospira restricta]QRJ64665.1 alpha/beta hydrolase [Azospira restricta]
MRRRILPPAALAIAAALLLAGCAGIMPKSGATQAEIESWATPRGYQAATLETRPFRLFSLLRQRRADSLLVIYIEGDGNRRPSPYRPIEPTPRTPHALRMAHQDESPLVAYLARPCQYLADAALPSCDSQHWVERRFEEEVIASMLAAVDELKRRSGARRVSLVGYGGGGTVATLLAGRRQDVVELITVAAPLALADWAALNRLGPLPAASDPAEQPALPRTLRATHFVGGEDEVVPPAFTASYVGRRGGELIYVADFGHDCCWAEEWPWLLERARGRESSP